MKIIIDVGQLGRDSDEESIEELKEKILELNLEYQIERRDK